MKRIAWGTSKLLWLYLEHSQDREWSYVIDDFTQQREIAGIPIKPSAQLAQESFGAFEVYVFAVSNASLRAILAKLASYGLELGKTVHLYSELFAASFAAKAQSQLGWSVDAAALRFATAATLNSVKLVHTTLCGSWLLLEAIRHLRDVPGAVAEIGCFEGGNALLCLQSRIWSNKKRYFLFDSFEGFPTPSPLDPSSIRAGDYAPSGVLGEILAPFASYPEVEIVKGFVPDSFAAIAAGQRFSLAFYDCDLYQPALDTFAFFWDRMEPGGLILIHDYFAEPGGFHGVRQATDEFFAARRADVLPFWENTMAVVRKT
jgi:hypothetical protein